MGVWVRVGALGWDILGLLYGSLIPCLDGYSSGTLFFYCHWVRLGLWGWNWYGIRNRGLTLMTGVLTGVREYHGLRMLKLGVAL